MSEEEAAAYGEDWIWPVGKGESVREDKDDFLSPVQIQQGIEQFPDVFWDYPGEAQEVENSIQMVLEKVMQSIPQALKRCISHEVEKNVRTGCH